MTAHPPAQAHVDAGLVRGLLADQLPDLAPLPVAFETSGWDNVTFRLGDALAVRMPRLVVSAELLVREQHWLPRLAPALPLPVPVPVHVGAPGRGYPWAWSVVPWFAGRTAEHAPLDPGEAGRFGAFLAALHRPAPPDAPRNDWRGVPLAAVEDLPGRLAAAAARVPAVAAVRPALDTLLAAARDAGATGGVAETLVHADLHPKNLVVDAGRLAAVLDWGDLTLGDPAIDLAAAWMLFDPAVHDRVWAGYGGPGAADLARARGWAVFFGVSLVESGLGGDAAFARVGALTLQRLAAGAA